MPTIRAAVHPEMLRWARKRAGLEQRDLADRFVKLPDWERGKEQPTLKQADAFARKVHVPLSYLFLTNPPEEALPVPDFRTFGGHAVRRPSPNLLDTIYACEVRQDWYRDYARAEDMDSLSFVGSASTNMLPGAVAREMNKVLRFDLPARRECPNWSDALRMFARRADEAGILVMVSGVVGSNNSRCLDPAEFRGFAMCDPVAPLVFVNGKDTKAAQMFTLAHELAHLWLGASALSNLGAKPDTHFREEEVWCNAVAAEFLVPLESLHSCLRPDEPLPDALSRLARVFKVSTLVVLRRMLDAAQLTRREFDAAWTQENERLRQFPQANGAGGGDFRRTTIARVGRRFARALISSTLEGDTLYRDAFRMLGIRKTETFDNLVREVGMAE